MENKCQAGSMNNLTGQATCRKCEPGTYQPGRGKPQCDVCPAGGYCTMGVSSGTPCEAGRYSNMTGLKTLHECVYCEPGFSCLIGATQPTPCSPGSIAPVARYVEVLARTLSASNLSKCELCEPGKIQDSNHPYPYPYPHPYPYPYPSPGKYQEVEGQVACKPCPPGAYCVAGAAAVVPCPGGYFNPDEGADNVTDCQECSPGHSCPPGTDVPVQCAPGFRTDESKPTFAERRNCTKCEEGTFQDEIKATYCKGCEKGGYCIEGAASVSPCPGGSYNDGFNKSNGAGCLKTNLGFYTIPGSSEQVTLTLS